MADIAETTVEKTIKRLGSKFDLVPLPGDSPFVKPASILYELDGKHDCIIADIADRSAKLLRAL